MSEDRSKLFLRLLPLVIVVVSDTVKLRVPMAPAWEIDVVTVSAVSSE